jgi:uncharacterized protein YukE
MAETKESLLKRASKLLEELDGKVSEIEKQLKDAKTDTKKDLQSHLNDLKGKKEELKGKMKDWQGKGGEAFAEIQKELDRLGGEVTKSLHNMYENIKKIFQKEKEEPKDIKEK